MQHFEEIDFGKTYHIYNKGINGERIFLYPEHYTRFLWLYQKYIDPVAETYAWCLMGNHFHFLLRIKTTEQISRELSKNRIKKPEINSKLMSRQFGNLFNAYSQSFNNNTKRTGGLFQTPFKRKPIDNEEYFTSVVHYIHNNPVKHGFCERIQEYPWSSYSSIVSITPNKIQRDKIIGWFDGKANFIAVHNGRQEIINISQLIIDEP
jgi:REP element-mobilizing transposase RayT